MEFDPEQIVQAAHRSLKLKSQSEELRRRVLDTIARSYQLQDAAHAARRQARLQSFQLALEHHCLLVQLEEQHHLGRRAARPVNRKK